MCGIFGYIGYIPEELAALCLDTLSHRGPDGYGIWHQPDITLGHRRLAILDLSDMGKQPMPYANGRFQITFNGEVYNFIELRRDLEKKGYSFLSESDTEVIIAAFIEWGPDCVTRFNGMWAFAIWDTVQKTLFLSRDRFGKKPLFYSFIGNDFVFASEMKAIFPLLDDISPSEDFKWMSEFTFHYESTDKCLVKGIKRFPGGHYGYVKDGRLSLARYWNTLDNLIEIPAKYDQQVELFTELFIDACRIRMRSDVPIGTSLSGGLDSSAVISTLAYIARTDSDGRMSSDWQHAFVAAFPGTPLDESAYAQKVVENIGIESTFLEIDPVRGIDKIDEYFYLFEELYHTTPPIPMIQLYGAMRERGVVVSLDGHGPDEQFSGYGATLFEAFPECGASLSLIRNILNTYKDLLPPESSQFEEPKNDLFLYANFMMRHFAKRIMGKPIKSQDSGHPNFKTMDNFNKHLYVMTHETILPTLLRNYDRYSMINGVEIRMPFMDHRLVSYAMSLPWSSKIRKGFTKSIVRDAVAPFMPYEIAYRKTKIGYNSPLVDWMKNQMKEYVLDTVHSLDFKTSQLVNPTKVKADIENIVFSEDATFIQSVAAWKGLVPYLWERAVLKRPLLM